jgi:hypothetical protein
MPIAIETHCSVLVQALKKDVNMRARWAGLISEIKDRCRLLPDCKIEHTRREANQVAHALAQLARSKRQCMLMHLDVPPEIRATAQKDRQGISVTSLNCNAPT